MNILETVPERCRVCRSGKLAVGVGYQRPEAHGGGVCPYFFVECTVCREMLEFYTVEQAGAMLHELLMHKPDKAAEFEREPAAAAALDAKADHIADMLAAHMPTNICYGASIFVVLVLIMPFFAVGAVLTSALTFVGWIAKRAYARYYRWYYNPDAVLSEVDKTVLSQFDIEKLITQTAKREQDDRT